MSLVSSTKGVDELLAAKQVSKAAEQLAAQQVRQTTPLRRKRLGSPLRTSSMFDEMERMLAEQRVAVERALAFNNVITERLATERLCILHGDCRDEEVKKPQLRTPRAVKISQRNDRLPFGFDGVDGELSKPLLPQAAEKNKRERSPSPPSSASPAKSRASATEPAADGLMRVRTEKDVMSWHMFPALQNVKDLVDKSLQKPDPHAGLFKDTGFFSWLAQTPFFNTVTLVVIVMNTLWIAYDTDCNHAELLVDADWQFQVAGNFFCTYFVLEIMIRILAFKKPCAVLLDYWFAFEIFLVALMVWETWISWILSVFGYSSEGSGFAAGSVLRIFRIFRLLRVARTARLLSSVPELMILIKGMLTAMRSVMCTLGLLALIIYIFAIVFTQLLAGEEFTGDHDNPFTTVPHSANFLLLQVLCGFDPDFATQVLKNNLGCYMLYLIYILVGSLTIMNMLVGILTDVVFTVANDEKEETFQREMEVKVEHLAETLDVNHHGRIARADFEQVFKRPEVILSLTELGVDVAGLMDFAHFVFQENEDLSYQNFEHMVVQFRGGKSATVKDVMNMRKQMSSQLSKILHAYDATHKFALGEKYGHEKMSDFLLDGSGKPNASGDVQSDNANPVVNMCNNLEEREFENPEIKQRPVVQNASSFLLAFKEREFENPEIKERPVVQNASSFLQSASSNRSSVSPNRVDISLSSPPESCMDLREGGSFRDVPQYIPQQTSPAPSLRDTRAAVANFAAHYGAQL